MPTKTKTWKSANGKISKAKFSGGRVRGGVIAGGILVGVSIWQNSESAGYHCAACLWGEYSQVYWEDNTPNQNHTAHCRNNPMDETCVQLLQPWQEEEGKQVCTTCPPYTVPNSIMAATYKWKRCFEDCSDAYNAMGGRNWQADHSASTNSAREQRSVWPRTSIAGTLPPPSQPQGDTRRVPAMF